MDRILSARVDESVATRISLLAKELHTTKKNIIEKAIDLLAESVQQNRNIDVFDLTCGAWNRQESATELTKRVRKTFRHSMVRHHS